MIEVEQRFDYDCMTACLASIFETAYEDTPVLATLVGDPVPGWYQIMDAWLEARGFAVMQRVLEENQVGANGERPMRCPWSYPGFWIAGVMSPRNDGEHALVMKGNEMLWDPHPGREAGHLGYSSCDYFVPLDPARLRLFGRGEQV